jgi:hypothetical protein
MSHLLVICAKRFNGHELWTLLGIVQKRGHTFEVVSQDTLIKNELTLRPNTIKRTVWNVDPEKEVLNYDAVVVVSGNMNDTEAYWKDPHVEKILKIFRKSEKLCAAICCSVPTLAPICAGVKVSFFPLMRSRDRLLRYDADLQTTSLSIDKQFGGTITAENQMMSWMWAEEICNHLEGKPPQHVLHDSGWSPKGSERKMSPEVRKAIDDARGYPMVMRKQPKRPRDPKDL